ncbi:MAG: PilZ domain-containing protein [Candidatus Omnitrophica bacterium]|nr:PilZ domain-containing protein [Candidatus Omnitrophota bacterium]
MKNIKKLEKAIPVDERRRFIRHQMCFPLNYKVVKEGSLTKDEKVQAKELGKKTHSTSIDISIGGILFSAKHPVKAGSVILIEMPFQDKIFNLRAMVAHCSKNKETKLYNIGAAFQKLSAAYKVKLVEQLCLISEFRDIRSIELGKQISLEKASKEWIKRYSSRFRRLYW